MDNEISNKTKYSEHQITGSCKHMFMLGICGRPICDRYKGPNSTIYSMRLFERKVPQPSIPISPESKNIDLITK